MSFIAISRGTFQGGKNLAETLAQSLNYRCIDRDVLVQRTSIQKASPIEFFADLDMPPSSDLCTLNHRRYVYLALLKAAIAEEANLDNVVYHGLVGHLLFPASLPVLSIRVIAPMEYRILEIQQRMGLNRVQALAHIAKVDNDRGKWTRYLYGIDWQDPSIYDLVINLQNVGVKQACHVITAMIREGGFEFTAPHYQAILKDFVLSSRIRAALAEDCMTSNLEVEIDSREGQVTIKGDCSDQAEEVQRVAAAVPGVLSVTFEEPALAEKPEYP